MEPPGRLHQRKCAACGIGRRESFPTADVCFLGQGWNRSSLRKDAAEALRLLGRAALEYGGELFADDLRGGLGREFFHIRLQRRDVGAQIPHLFGHGVVALPGFIQKPPEVSDFFRHIAFDETGDAIRDTAYIKTIDSATNAWKFVTQQKAS